MPNWRNKEPWISVEGAIWDVKAEQLTIPEAMVLIRKYIKDYLKKNKTLN